MEEKLEPELWDFNKDGLYCGWFKEKKLPKNCIDKALKKIEKKYGKNLKNRHKAGSHNA